MANITEYLRKIKSAVFGKDVRDSIHDAIQAINADVSTVKSDSDHAVEVVLGIPEFMSYTYLGPMTVYELEEQTDDNLLAIVAPTQDLNGPSTTYTLDNIHGDVGDIVYRTDGEWHQYEGTDDAYTYLGVKRYVEDKITSVDSREAAHWQEFNSRWSELGQGLQSMFAAKADLVNGKIPASQIPTDVMEYKGKWNASTNTPTIQNGVGDKGDVYIVDTAGTWNGIDFSVNDRIIFNGSVWERIPSGEVMSVNGKTGPVVLTASDVGALPSNTVIPSQLSELSGDSTHRTVTDAQIESWDEGTSVEVTPLLTSGTKIATFTVDEESIDIYAPEGGSGGGSGGIYDTNITILSGLSIPAGETGVTVTSDKIKADSLIDIYYEDEYDVETTYTQAVGSVTITLSEASSEVIRFSMKITNEPTPISYNDLSDTPNIPTQLSELESDETHRVVTDAQIQAWNNKGNGNMTAAVYDPDGNISTAGGIKAYINSVIADAIGGGY